MYIAIPMTAPSHESNRNPTQGRTSKATAVYSGCFTIENGLARNGIQGAGSGPAFLNGGAIRTQGNVNLVLNKMTLVNNAATADGRQDSPGLVLINTSKYKGNIITPVVKPTTVLVDTAGKPFDIRAMTPGGVTLLFFGYTHCPDECPLTMASTAAALRQLHAAQMAHQDLKPSNVLVFKAEGMSKLGDMGRAWSKTCTRSFSGSSS